MTGTPILARRAAGAIGLGRHLRDDEVILDDRYHAGSYGIPDESTLWRCAWRRGSRR